MDLDGYPDLVVSSGNDDAKEEVTVFLNDQQGRFSRSPQWRTQEPANNMTLAVGDIDGDGRPDVVVAALDLSGPRGGARVFRNGPDGLERTPSFVSGGPGTPFTFAFSVALGDADADGDLDLAVGYAVEGPLSPPEGAPCADRGAGRVRVYRNDGGRFDRAPMWTSEIADFNAGLTFTDLNGDGWLDLVVGSSTLRVYRGRPEGPGATLSRAPLTLDDREETTAGMRPDDGFMFFLAPAWVGAAHEPVVVASRHYLSCHGVPRPENRSAYVAFGLRGGRVRQVWSSAPDGRLLGSGVVVADFDGDGLEDVVGASHDRPGLTLFRGSHHHEGLGAALRLPGHSDRGTRAQAVASGDLRRRCLRTRRDDLMTRSPVVTLERRPSAGVEAVCVNGRLIRKNAYAWSHDSRWLSVSRELLGEGEDPTRVQIVYRTTDAPDVVVVHQLTSAPTLLYYSTSPCQAPVRID